MEPNEKYLDHLQSIIQRHNTNSFLLKGWAISISTAIFIYAGSSKEPKLALISIIPTLLFWFLDSIYLANERCFVSLYNSAVNNYSLVVPKNDIKDEVKSNEDVHIIDTKNFDMNIQKMKIIKKNNWYKVMFSKTIVWFYLAIVVFAIIIFINLRGG